MYGARAWHSLLSPLTFDLLKGGVGARRVIWGQHISCWWVRVVFINVWVGGGAVPVQGALTSRQGRKWNSQVWQRQEGWIKGTFLYITTTTTTIKMSYPSSFNCGVPQGSVVDLLLLSILNVYVDLKIENHWLVALAPSTVCCLLLCFHPFNQSNVPLGPDRKRWHLPAEGTSLCFCFFFFFAPSGGLFSFSGIFTSHHLRENPQE